MNNFEQIPLRDIHLPAPVSWWPPAPGWWLLLIIVAIAAVAGYWWWRKNQGARQRRRVEQSAERELDRIEAAYLASHDSRQLLASLSILLRRVAMSLSPRRQVAGLCGDEWSAWLQYSAPVHGLDEQTLAQLVNGPYRKDVALDASSLVPTLRRWLHSVARREGLHDSV